MILDSTAAVTIHGSPNTSIWGGIGPTTIVDPAKITIAEGNAKDTTQSAGNATATVTSDSVEAAGNNFNDTIKASGASDTLEGGTGHNLISSTGAANVIFAGDGIADIYSSGVGTQIGLMVGLANVGWWCHLGLWQHRAG